MSPETPDWRARLVSAAQAVRRIRSGDRVFVGSACATPRALLGALGSPDGTIAGVQLFHFLTDGAIPLTRPGTRFHHHVFFVGRDARGQVSPGALDYVPLSVTHVHRLLENGRLPLDVALVQVSPPDAEGFCSLGVSVDVTLTAVKAARTVLAEVNPHMPRTRGTSRVHVSELTELVLADAPVIEYQHEPAGAVAEQIARYVARIIDDGSTLQVGLGRVPNEMLRFLTNRRDLGVHSDVITDPLVDLIERGVVTGSRKTLHPGLVVASTCMGSRRLYDLVDDNPAFRFEPIHVVCDPAVIAANEKMVSVTQAFAVDLTGQICVDQFGGELYGGLSAQAEFMRGAAAAPGGKAIVCLASTTDDGKTSRIRPALLEGEAAAIARSDVHYVVTEYGLAYLFGKSISERAIALVEIAHPAFRDGLLAEARARQLVPAKATMKSRRAYPLEEERSAALRDGTSVLVRPTQARDVGLIQELFYSLSEEDVYTRFFTNLTSLSTSHAQHLCSVSYDDEMAFVAVVGDRERETAIGSGCYYVNQATNMADVAYMIHPAWQGKGLAQLLQSRLVEHARRRGLRGFTADVLAKNARMLAVFERSGYQVVRKVASAVYEVQILFDAA